MKPETINFLYTNIGRGHPFYLDGVIEALIRKASIGLVRGESDVLETSRGISYLGWKAVHLAYRWGSLGGRVGRAYSRFRSKSDYNRSVIVRHLLGRSIRIRYMNDKSPLMVAHPILVAALKGKGQLFYQHGENVVPDEAQVEGAMKVFVPTDEAAWRFTEYGYTDNDVVITGLCVEPSLVRQADDAYEMRVARIGGTRPLAGAFYSSGAEPKQHVEKLAIAAVSAVQAGGKVIVFSRMKGALAKTCNRFFLDRGIGFNVLDSRRPFPGEFPPALIVISKSRREESIFTAKLFGRFDYIVAPSHERTNWGLGLGLPMFIVGPETGSFAPLNRELLLVAGVARQIKTRDNAVSFGHDLNVVRSDGSLLAMAEAGWGKQSINGFETIADYLVESYASGM
ncbi:MAG: hypothetical protein U9R56_03565 [candidate division Zixibacteria bacterium]|nr:hypothetical protein [candidate division Zixibacteria bacterium]